MNNSRRLPSYIVPTEAITLDGLRIAPANPVTVNDDWQRDYWSGSILVEENGYNGVIDNWVYLHALLTDSRLPVYVLHAEGGEASSFQVDEFDNKGDANIAPRQVIFKPNNLLPAVYLNCEGLPKVSYGKVYEEYLAQSEIYLSAVKNYFVAQDINHHKRLRYINTSYWQVVMLVSVLEALLPQPVFCEGRCETCDKGVKHTLNDLGKEWNELLFDRVKDQDAKKQYRIILDEARWRIRNDTVHNGLAPLITRDTFDRALPLPDGVTEYTPAKSIAEYKTSQDSLDGLVELLRQICRNTLLNQVIAHDIFPALKGMEVHKRTLSISHS